MTPENDSAARVANYQLENGMQVVIIPDRRAPVVTHMVWYRNGSADDPPGKSGIAHFLEHLMFKGTKTHPKGEFSEMVGEIGGQENAFTSNDYTAYFQRVAKEHLGLMMSFEADRMTGLELTDEIVAPERDVVLEERRMHCDADPSAQLNEAVQATLFSHHPYGTPIIGWGHEIEELGREDALAYYHRFYTPENAILMLAGDVEPEEGLRLARQHYGRIAARGEAPVRRRSREPESVAKRLVTVNDEKVEQPSWQRVYITPSYRTAAPGESEALEVLAHLIGGGQTSLLYRELVVDQKKAVAAGAYYMGTALDDTRFYIYAMPTPGVSLPELDAAVDAVLARFVAEPLEPEALERAKTRLIADAIYAQDSQAMLARWYGASLATGQTIQDIQEWPARIEATTPDAIIAAARKWLSPKRAVTGYLLPTEADEA
jgi:zinc protease